jgi:hypothetical protein
VKGVNVALPVLPTFHSFTYFTHFTYSLFNLSPSTNYDSRTTRHESREMQ